jgi:ribonuclease VapC
MIAIDASAILAIALGEPESERFSRAIAAREGLVGTPTLVESRMALSMKIDDPDRFIDRFVAPPEVHVVAFSLEMYRAAVSAFDRFGCGHHPARLNFGDCMAYAVARVHDAPLLYKGGDFEKTDVKSAFA